MSRVDEGEDSLQVRARRLHAPDSWAKADRGTWPIVVVSAIGVGDTLLSSFDAALWHCGVHNFNLLALSSVVPPASEIVICDRYEARADEYGHKLYVVKAEMRSAEPDAVIAAGLGWLQSEDGSGVFVEHEMHEPNSDCEEIERAIADTILASLRDLAARRAVAFVEHRVGTVIAGTRVQRQPTCALVLAVYKSEGWR